MQWTRTASLCSPLTPTVIRLKIDLHAVTELHTNLSAPGTLDRSCERPGIPGGGAARRERRALRLVLLRAPRLCHLSHTIEAQSPRATSLRSSRRALFPLSISSGFRLSRWSTRSSRLSPSRGPATPGTRASLAPPFLQLSLCFRTSVPFPSHLVRPGPFRRGFPGRPYPRSTPSFHSLCLAVATVGPAV